MHGSMSIKLVDLQLPYACREGTNSSRGIAPLHHGTSHVELWLASRPGRFTSKKFPDVRKVRDTVSP
jgi:hypothetical protein